MGRCKLTSADIDNTKTSITIGENLEHGDAVGIEGETLILGPYGDTFDKDGCPVMTASRDGGKTFKRLVPLSWVVLGVGDDAP